MTQDHFTVYQFMVSKFGGQSFDTIESFSQGLLANTVTKRFVPSKTWAMYNIDTKEILAEGYLCRYGFDLIKVKDGQVCEYYRRLVSGRNSTFVAYDLDTLDIIESYKNIGNQLWKYDWKTGEKLQANNNCTYDTLPEEIKRSIKDFRFRHHIFMYAHKPYGRIVEFYYPKH
ncbi:hypothetical protein Meth11DRAFT_1151 [Methylophilaceae bacterium 11]|nr:hypothetical protein Meth11DRAFT_1151 [Methylophilaceae bacterium 11]